MGLTSDLKKFVSICRMSGFRSALAELVKTLAWRYYPPLRKSAERFRIMQEQDRLWDERNGVETCGDSPLQSSGVPQNDLRRGNSTYRPINEELFAEGLSCLDVDLSQLAFVDYGSGKGKALMLAADHPFREIVGIEYAPGLHEVACRNLSRFSRSSKACQTLRVELGDAMTFTPPRDPLLCFFFNPFDHETLRQVILRLKTDWEANPRPIILLYVNWRTVKERLKTFQAEPSLNEIHISRHVAAFRFDDE